MAFRLNERETMSFKGTGDHKSIFMASYARVFGQDNRQFLTRSYNKFLASLPVVVGQFRDTDLQRHSGGFRSLLRSLHSYTAI